MAQALLLLCISSLLAGGVLSQFGPFGPGSQGGNSAADDFQNMLDWLDKFSGMSPAQQNIVLMGAGMALQAKTGMDCNIFGGPFSCKPVPTNSSYVQQCGAQAEQKVDCALYSEVTANLFDSPVDDLQDFLATTLGPQVKDLCPQCFERVQSLWCALAAPPCGTFGTLVQGGILPVLSQAVKVYRSKAGASRADAVATIMGAALTMAGAGLPCRSMCKAMDSTCSCGGLANDTLGTLLSWLSSQQQLKASHKLPSGAYLRVIFKDVWDVPFCSLFPEDGSQSAGARCTPLSPVPLTCTSQKQWCDVAYKQNTDTFKYVQSIMLLQLLRATTGWFTNDNEIIWGIHHSVKDAVDQGPSTASSTDDLGYEAAPQSASLGVGQVIGITFLSLFAATLAAVGGVAAWKWWKARNAESQYFQLTEKENFVSLSAGMH